MKSASSVLTAVAFPLRPVGPHLQKSCSPRCFLRSTRRDRWRGILRCKEGEEITPAENEESTDASPKEQMEVIQPSEEPSGPLNFVVNFLTWSFIIFLFAGSIFFTVSRQFLPDMQPLDLSNPPL